jgi:hypothetical protein
MIGIVSETLGITQDEATVLLIAHRWNEERLKDTWFDREAHVRIKPHLIDIEND